MCLGSEDVRLKTGVVRKSSSSLTGQLHRSLDTTLFRFSKNKDETSWRRHKIRGKMCKKLPRTK